jgi:hypothetical protein
VGRARSFHRQAVEDAKPRNTKNLPLGVFGALAVFTFRAPNVCEQVCAYSRYASAHVRLRVVKNSRLRIGRRACVLLMALYVVGCGRGGIADASDAAALHLAAFARFSSWAERVARSDVGLRGELALRETMFAPLRANRAVVWAEVRPDAGYPLQFPAPLLLDGLHFVSIDGGELGPLRVALSDACRVSGRQHAPSGPCVIIAKSARAGANAEAPLTMAFRVTPASDSQISAGPLQVSASIQRRATGR